MRSGVVITPNMAGAPELRRLNAVGRDKNEEIAVGMRFGNYDPPVSAVGMSYGLYIASCKGILNGDLVLGNHGAQAVVQAHID